MDERIKSTLDKIVRLANQDAEFDKELRKALGVKPSSKSLSTQDERITKIEKYLGLDYYIDDKDSIIDYSFVTDTDVRMQLVSDNREMLRFRYGTRYHQIDFSEYCRYAQLQSEMLINYFYDKKNNGSFNKIKDHIKRFNSYANIPDYVHSLGAIQYNVKLWSMMNEFNIIHFDVWDKVRYVRNDLSHRAPEEGDLTIETYKKQLESYGFTLNVDGSVQWFSIKDNEDLKEKYESEIKKSKAYKQYLYKIWLSQKPFDTIILALKELSSIVKTNL